MIKKVKEILFNLGFLFSTYLKLTYFISKCLVISDSTAVTYKILSFPILVKQKVSLDAVLQW